MMTLPPDYVEFDYEPRWVTSAGAGVVSLVGAAAFAFFAISTKTVSLFGLVDLTGSAAIMFHLFFLSCCALGVATSIYMIVMRAQSVQRIALTEEGIVLPTDTNYRKRTEKQIAYADIEAVKTQTVSGQRYLYLYAHGLRYIIYDGFLPRKSDFDTLVADLVRRTQDPPQN